MSDRSFFDTNVLVYTDDASSPAKKQRALELLEEERRSGTGVLSTQVLVEYFSAATRKLGVDPRIASRKVELFARFQVVLLDVELIQRAIELHRLHSISICDALVVRAAQAARCRVLYTENLQTGWRPEGLAVVNPFR
ncbi:MAG: PIN domain-containing protein [Thermoanaerobaculia bacterium]|nr:PIN domain-containing protein [Thermoanaerobaculia bacterium]